MLLAFVTFGSIALAGFMATMGWTVRKLVSNYDANLKDNSENIKEVRESMDFRFTAFHDAMDAKFLEVRKDMDFKFTVAREEMDRRFTEVHVKIDTNRKDMDENFKMVRADISKLDRDHAEVKATLDGIVSRLGNIEALLIAKQGASQEGVVGVK